MTAEFAMVMPAVMLVLAACLAAANLGVLSLTIQDAAAVVARMEARGGRGASAAAISAMARTVPGATVRLESRGSLVCASVSTRARVLGLRLGTLDLIANSCAPTVRP